MAATERGIFLEQSLLHVEAERLGLLVAIARLDLRRREFVDLSVLVEHVEQRFAAILGLLGDQLLRPHLLDLEALRELHELPEIGPGLARSGDELMPELGAALG